MPFALEVEAELVGEMLERVPSWVRPKPRCGTGMRTRSGMRQEAPLSVLCRKQCPWRMAWHEAGRRCSIGTWRVVLVPGPPPALAGTWMSPCTRPTCHAHRNATFHLDSVVDADVRAGTVPGITSIPGKRGLEIWYSANIALHVVRRSESAKYHPAFTRWSSDCRCLRGISQLSDDCSNLTVLIGPPHSSSRSRRLVGVENAIPM